MVEKFVLLIIGIILVLPRLLAWLRRLVKAIRDANTFRPVNHPSMLYVDLKTKTWCRGLVPDQTIWWRVFFNSWNRKPL